MRFRNTLTGKQSESERLTRAKARPMKGDRITLDNNLIRAAMSRQERARLVELLDAAEREYQDRTSELSDEQWVYKVTPVTWSVGEIAEHIMLAESLLFGCAEMALGGPEDSRWSEAPQGKVELLEKALPNRAFKATAPSAVVPIGMLSREEIMARYRQARARTRDFAEHTDLPLKAFKFKHPFPVFDWLSAYDWLLYIPLHHLRHNIQIAEVIASSGYPR